ncbi:MAG: transcription-repair coupling factor [Bacteriovoracaceae bacterium]|nr:transcription-repair coupling factor [Bacteriovoracaceae bacterium]
MNLFNPLINKIVDWQQDDSPAFQIDGFSPAIWPFFLTYLTSTSFKKLGHKDHVIICPSIDIAENLYSSLKKNITTHEICYYPGSESSPYTYILSSEKNLYTRFKALDKIVYSNLPKIIVCTFEGPILNSIPKSLFEEHSIDLEVSDIVAPHELARKLVSIGYSSSTTVEEPGTFAQKGEIFDIFPTSGFPVRIHYFDDMLEEIFAIDLVTQKTNRSTSYKTLHLCPSPNILSNSEFRGCLRENIPMPGPQFKAKFEKRKHIFSTLAQNQLFENYPVYSSLFFKNEARLLDYLDPQNTLITVLESSSTYQNTTEYLELLRSEFEQCNNDSNSDQILPKPNNLYSCSLLDELKCFKRIEVDKLPIISKLGGDLKSSISLKIENAKMFLLRHVSTTGDKFQFLKDALVFLKEFFKYSGHILISTNSTSSKNEIKYLFEQNEFSSDLLHRIEFIDFELNEGFFYSAEKLLLLTDGDLFTKKQRKIKKSAIKKIDLFAEQLSTMKKGDYVIHNTHGIGEYQGLESLDIGDNKTDYIVILYEGNDKVYLPVYKMNLIQKHADSNANLKVANLRSNKFKALKERAYKSVKKLAFDLLRLQAERQSSSAYAFSPPDHHFNEFELAFPFEETPDQMQAIENVISSMQNHLPMDHLVCGDVGFGKTEVAMRCAFKAVLDKKQSAILVPTTILALQHYNSFCERFKDFAVNIEFLSRFKTPKETKAIKEDLLQGKIDIIIGTHKLLSDTVKYKDLGLVVVDEEQRFGVGHKEKLKLLKSSVDFLTMTATPIPRTLQLAFLGIRDLSLIQTAPPRRQSIKTYIIQEDPYTIKTAIEKELSRGGQVFYVHNRVNDMEIFLANLRELVPKAKIIMAHGQLPERELEKRVNAFYAGSYQILLSTTIIESGLDIPNANTMIIDRADTFGLSQLHQLRGRIGRSEKKAYAYFVIPKHNKLNAQAEARLKALHTYADIGSGFSLASCDLEIRGAGDILGGEQSGHIEAIGLELYTELLKETIQEIKGEKKVISKDIEISTPFAAYIPNHYIDDSSMRLKYYKKLSNCSSIVDLNNYMDEISDIFGIYPQELSNLFTLFESKIYLQNCGISTIQVAGKVISIKFDQNILQNNLELRNKVVETFISRPKVYRFTPDYKVIYSHKTIVEQQDLVKFSKNVAEQIMSC